MAGMDDLAAAVKMAEMLNPKAEIAASDPYAPFAGIANSLGTSIAQSGNRFNTRDMIVGSLLSGLVGGGLSGLSDSYQNDASNAFLRAIGGDQSAGSDLPEGLFSKASSINRLFKAQGMASNLANQQEIEKARQTALVKAITDNPGNADNIIAAYKKLEGGGGSVGEPTEAKPMIKEEKKGPLSLKERILADATELRNQGLPGGAALDTASKINEAERARLKSSEKKSGEIRTAAQAMQQAAGIAESGVEGAGNTGGFFNTPRDWLSSLYATFSQDEANQRTSQKLLDSVAPDIIKASRSLGVGAMSDPEMRAYLGAGPTSTKTPDENRILIEKMNNVASANLDYADFLDWYRDNFNSMSGAEELWRKYKEANPLLVKGKDGFDFNKQRMPWSDFVTNPEAALASKPAMQKPSPMNYSSGPEYLAAVRAWEASGGK